MLCDVIIEAELWAGSGIEELAERAAGATLSHLGYQPADFEIAVLACDDQRIATLNAEFRDKKQATNVLSWPEVEQTRDASGNPGRTRVEAGPFATALGDIAISFETCQREAAAAEKPFGEHVTHLMVHGCLHLLGYDHVSDTDAMRMEGLEVEILASLGLKDPYGVTGPEGA